MALTQKQLKKWTTAGAPIAGISDGGGLTFTLSSAGTASWTFRYRHAGKQREITLGNYPDMALEKAREAARAARVMVDLGKDVAGEKRRAKADAAAARSFREVAEEHLAKRQKIKPKTLIEWRRYMEKDVYPALGNIAIGDVTVNEIRDLVKRVTARSQTVGRRTFEMLSVIFGHAMGDGAIDRNPMAGLKVQALVGELKSRRQRVHLSRDELVLLLSSAPALGRINELTIKILLATCVRKGELIGAKKADLNLTAAEWTIPDENSKTGRGYVIPLAPPVIGWFRELIAYSGNSHWVLPARNGPGRYQDRHHVHEHTLNVALERSAFGIRAFTPHDLRSTARGHLSALGVAPLVAERCLNHSLGGLVAVYDKHDYLDERREALTKWANLLAELDGKPNNVVPLRAAA